MKFLSKKIIWVFLFQFSLIYSWGQIDSVEIETRIEQMKKELRELKKENNELFGKKAFEYKDFAQKHNRLEEEEKAWRQISYYYMRKGDYDSLGLINRKLIEAAQQISPIHTASAYLYTISYFHHKNELDSVEFYLTRAEKITKRAWEEKETATDLDKLISVYSLTRLKKIQFLWGKGNYNEALLLCEEMLTLLNEHPNKKHRYLVYGFIGYIYAKQKNYNKALDFYSKEMEVAKSVKNDVWIAFSMVHLGRVYLKQKKYDKADKNLLAAYELFQKNDYLSGLGSNLFHLCTSAFEQKKWSDLHKYGDAYLALKTNNPSADYQKYMIYSYLYSCCKDNSVKVKKYKDDVLKWIAENQNDDSGDDLSEYEFEMLKNIGEADMALDYYERRVRKKDSILISKQFSDAMIEMDTKYHTSLKEAQLAEQKLENQKQKTYTYFALGAVAFLLLLGGSGYLYNWQKQKQKELKKQQELSTLQQNMTQLGLSNLNNQINSHDFKNTLTAALNEVQEKAPKSYQHICDLLQITESALYSDSYTDSLRNQFHQIKGLVDLTQNRLFEKVHLHIDNRIDEEVQIPRLLLKNLVENSLKHGIKGTGKDAEIIVSCSKKEDNFVINVKDSGKGLKKEQMNAGKGISVYQELFAYFNKRNERKAHFEIKNWENGARAIVKIPLDYRFV